MGRKSSIVDHRARRYIRIQNEDSWKLIDGIAAIGKYKNSFNAIINDALIYGLPSLYASLFGITDNAIEESDRYAHDVDEEFNATLILLLKEIVLNVTINKSLLSSIFNAKYLEYNKQGIPAKQFEQGAFSDTPDYLENYEMRALKNLRK